MTAQLLIDLYRQWFYDTTGYVCDFIESDNPVTVGKLTARYDRTSGGTVEGYEVQGQNPAHVCYWIPIRFLVNIQGEEDHELPLEN